MDIVVQYSSIFFGHSHPPLYAFINSSLKVRLAELSATGVCRSTKKLAQHRGPVNKAALIGDSPHCFLTGGEDGVVFHIDVREPRPNKILIQKVMGMSSRMR